MKTIDVSDLINGIEDAIFRKKVVYKRRLYLYGRIIYNECIQYRVVKNHDGAIRVEYKVPSPRGQLNLPFGIRIVFFWPWDKKYGVTALRLGGRRYGRAMSLMSFPTIIDAIDEVNHNCFVSSGSGQNRHPVRYRTMSFL